MFAYTINAKRSYTVIRPMQNLSINKVKSKAAATKRLIESRDMEKAIRQHQKDRKELKMKSVLRIVSL
jgi:hypothetical protein